MILISIGAHAGEIQQVAPSFSAFENAANQIKCKQSDYMPLEQNQSKLQACQQCMQKVQKIHPSLNQAVNKGISTNAAQNAKGSITQGANAAATEQKQTGTNKGASGGYSSGAGDMAAKASNANEVGSAFDSCAQEMQSSCDPGNLMGNDAKGASDAKNACEQGSKTAKAVAAEKAGNGMDMGQLGQMASQLAQGLGSMMQQKPKGSEGGASSPDLSSSGLSTTPTESALATLGSSSPDGQTQQAQSATFDGVQPGKVAEIGGASFGEGGKNGTNVGNGGSAGQAASATPYDSGGAGMGGGGNGYLGSDPRTSGGGGGASVGALGSAGGSGAGAGGNSSGASSYDPDAAAAKAAAGGEGANGSYEISAGGGSGGRFFGLKSKSADLSELDGALGPDSNSLSKELAALDEGEGSRELASDGEAQSADIHADGSSLFSVVRSKLVEIKKRGNI